MFEALGVLLTSISIVVSVLTFSGLHPDSRVGRLLSPLQRFLLTRPFRIDSISEKFVLSQVEKVNGLDSKNDERFSVLNAKIIRINIAPRFRRIYLVAFSTFPIGFIGLTFGPTIILAKIFESLGIDGGWAALGALAGFGIFIFLITKLQDLYFSALSGLAQAIIYMVETNGRLVLPLYKQNLALGQILYAQNEIEGKSRETIIFKSAEKASLQELSLSLTQTWLLKKIEPNIDLRAIFVKLEEHVAPSSVEFKVSMENPGHAG